MPEVQLRDSGTADTEDRLDAVTPNMVAALHGLLDAPGAPPALGDPLPPLWHWLAFLPNAPQRELGGDGHPAESSFAPANHPPRRMFAGGRLTFEGDVPVGAVLTRHSRAASISTKEGRSGPLMFVEIDHEISTKDGSRISEVQDIVYRQAETTSKSPPTTPLPETAPDDNWEWTYALDPSPTLLFRFSALTYNAHRIHYDVPYVQDVEGYPNLVVHGPLQAIALAEVCRRNVPDQKVVSFAFRAEKPAFTGAPLLLRGRATGRSVVELQAVTAHNTVSMTATATLE
jgi:3-methylfumaryl-CoA hydratase